MVDRVIRLYDASETDFITTGLGAITDATSCKVTEEYNGPFELEMKYPIYGRKYGDILFRNFIYAKPNPYANPQPFRIYGITKPTDGIVTVNAAHISYDLADITCAPFSATSIVSAFANMKAAADIECPFEFWTDKITTANMETHIPYNMRALLGGIEGSILDTYRGEYEFDGYTVKLWGKRGTDRGVQIRYGKNLTSIKQEENISEVYTAVRPFWYREITDEGADDGGLVELPEKIVSIEGSSSYIRILPVDFTSTFDHKPTVEELRSATEEYINTHDIGVPKVSLDVSFANLADTEEYKNIAVLEKVMLCDTVDVEFPALGVMATAKVIKTTYDVLAGRYDSIELGSEKANLVTSISTQEKKIETKTSKTELQSAIAVASSLITGNSGGYVVTYPVEQPQELLIMDAPSIESAQNVWRWNSGGLAFSSNGYAGPFTTAITADGKIVADFILAGTMSANLIKGGVLQLGSRLNQNGSLEVYDETNRLISSLDKNGLRMYGTDGFYLSVNPEDGFAGFDGRTSPPSKLFWVNEDEFHQKKSVVEEEITLFNKMKFIPVTIRDNNNQIVNDGVALVSVAT